ncbi:hypothetical protein CDCA_CDCA04G1277 [Cyanidium caldarium]|uniref:7-cyano-7-deazaguanine synthase n=1 Tax=Cyanidium caldarium TaxID=2771 RepID=A0AAV9ISL9_CYACA|nr:hypothetical protein CDCA_CDCA04G1277 [Cyanidium caldarium]
MLLRRLSRAGHLHPSLQRLLPRCYARVQADPAHRDAVVLLSGGLDSATALAVARRDGYRCHALTFEYGQRHAYELEAARRVAEALQVHRHAVMRLGALGALGGSALTSVDLQVPKAERTDEPVTATAIPSTYVPARNTIFLSYALAYAEVHGAYDIFIGANAVDYSGYPDCRPEYFAAFERLAQLATKAGVERQANDGQPAFRIHTPLLRLRKEEIIARGVTLGVDYSLTHSCYDPLPPDGAPCQRCDACRLRQAAFRKLGRHDPLLDKHAALLSAQPGR